MSILSKSKSRSKSKSKSKSKFSNKKVGAISIGILLLIIIVILFVLFVLGVFTHDNSDITKQKIYYNCKNNKCTETNNSKDHKTLKECQDECPPKIL